MNKIIVLNIILSFLLFGCEKHNTKTLPYSGEDYKYYPTEIGSYVIYDVTEIVHDKYSEILDTFEYRIKEVMASEFINEAGEKTLRIERFIKSSKPYDSANWSIKDIWVANKTTNKITRTEENFIFSKLVFPINEGDYWDMNISNINNTYYVEYKDVHSPYTLNSEVFDSTVTVFRDDDSKISQNTITEVYAKGIGLIYKRVNDYRFISTVSTEIETGTELIYSYVSHN